MWKWTADNAKGVVVMIHGAAEHHGRYKWLIEMWRLEGYHVIMGDLPGQGTTTRRRGHILSFDEYIEEVEEWIREAKTFNLPIFLLGHSMGGLISIRALEEKELDVRGVILSSPCLGLVKKPNKAMDILSKGLNVVMPSIRFDSGLSVKIATRNKEVQDMDENDTLYVTKVSVRWYRELMKAVEQAFFQIKKYPNIPTLVMQGGEDLIVDKIYVRKWFDQLQIREKSFKEWDGLYHEIFNEPERDNVFETARRFIDAHIEES
ncbi:alpha/beta hydrolase [Bacillus kexueae]|uniref:alpha/beta hydrolase n=1 Tax=Aeribacillus kexueae TaxID=2078952 RepID=UPI001FAFA6D0|nr:alpha/beta hydrolase [Bacillus kexueae]